MKRNFTFYFGNSVSKRRSDPDEMQKNNKNVSPRESVIRNLLNYSKSLSTCQLPELGHVFLVMN